MSIKNINSFKEYVFEEEITAIKDVVLATEATIYKNGKVVEKISLFKSHLK